MSRLRVKLLGALCSSVLLAGAAFAGPPDAPVADAAMRGDVEAVRTLLKQGEDVNAAQGDGMTALHWAADRADRAMAEMLVYAGANVRAVTRIGQYTPLHIATRRGSAPVAELLLGAGADVSARTTNSGAAPLHLAAASGQAELVSLLLAHGADANVREGEWGQTPLIIAASLNRTEAVRALLEGGADPHLASVAVDLQEQSRIESAVRERQQEVLEAMLQEEHAQPSSSQLVAAVSPGARCTAPGSPRTRSRPRTTTTMTTTTGTKIGVPPSPTWVA